MQQLARPSEAVLQRLRVDTRYIHAGAAADFQGGIVAVERDNKVWHDLTDEFGVRWSMPDHVPLDMDITHHPLAEATIDDLDGFRIDNAAVSRASICSLRRGYFLFAGCQASIIFLRR